MEHEQELSLASGIGLILILLGAFIAAIGYGNLVQCLSVNIPSDCWSPRAQGAFGFYAGTIVAILSAIILIGPSLAGSLSRRKPEE